MSEEKHNQNTDVIVQQLQEIEQQLDGTEIASNPPEFVQLLPLGKFAHPKRRFDVTERAVNQIIDNYEAQGRDLVVDYEHQSLSGEEAPAAGWIKKLQNESKNGLWALVEWTSKAKDYLKNREYRYLSPVLDLSAKDIKTGKEIGVALHSVALTNTPFLEGLTPIVAKKVTDIEGSEGILNRLKDKLGLERGSDELAIQRRLEQLLSMSDKFVSPEILDLLGLKSEAPVDEVRRVVEQLKQSADLQPNKDYVPREDYLALKWELELERRNKIVDKALLTGKITPAQRLWAEEYALADPEGFDNFLSSSPRILPLSRFSSEAVNKRGAVLDEFQRQVNQLLDLDESVFKKYNQL